MLQNLERILHFIGGSAQDQSGNTSTIFAATLVPILANIGASIDYGRAVDARSALQNAADAAALAEDAVLDIKSFSNIGIAAPSFGPYTALAIIQDPDSEFGETSSIEGGGTLRIVGSIYLPEQILKVGGRGNIGQDSPYMPVIAKQVKFHGNATITINVDADTEDYPGFLPALRAGTPRLIS